VIAAPGVPVRDYTDTMLEKLTAAPGYGEDYSQGVLANVVSEENNVRQVAAKIALGEADAGIVYVSDVTPDLAADVRMIAISDPYNTIATYPIAVASDTAQPELARAFADFVVSEAGQDALARWGFIPARHSEPFAHQLEVIVEGLHSLWKAGW
jgi:molybdate transport system substrate-binding protein